MRRILGLVLTLSLLAFPFAAMAQQAAPGAAVTQTGSTGLAAQQCIQSTATSSVATTITIPSPGGSNAIYLDYIVGALYSTAAVTTTTTPLVFTTTNFSGTPSFPVGSGVAGGGNLAAAGGQVVAAGANGSLAIPIKALVGTSPTIVSPTANAGYFPVMTACWHVAP